MLSLAASPLPVDGAAQPTVEIELALGHLANIGERLGDAGLHLESSQLELHYQVLNSRSMAGETLGALDLLRFYLDAAARAIQTRNETSPMCVDGQPTSEGRALDEVFRTHYVGKIQPYTANVHHQAQVWLSEINRMARVQMGQMTPAFAAYFDAQINMDANQGLWSKYQRAVARHTDAWRSVVSQWQIAEDRKSVV